MKISKLPTACTILIISSAALAMDDPEMSYIDTSPDNRVQPPEGITSKRGRIHFSV